MAKCILILVTSLLYCIYSFSIKDNSSGLVAESESVLDPNGELLLKWRVNYSTRKINFQLVLSKKAPTINWFALGFSDRGQLQLADICLVWTDYNGHDHFEDTHSDEDGRLSRDLQQDCEAFHVDTGSRSITFSREFDTCDDDDYIIEDGTVHVVWARGVDKLFSSKGLCLNCTSSQDRGFIRVRLLTPPARASPSRDAQQLRFTNKHLKVPGDDTTYWCKVTKLPEFITETVHHIIKFESTITVGNEGLVHHMELFYCDAEPRKDIPLYEGNCFSPARPEATKVCSKVKAAWAMGAPPFAYPAEAGLPLGGPNANKYVMLEVHYNNPEMKKDWVDSSGLVLTVSGRRRYDAAIMELGLEYSDKMAIPAGQAAFPLTGYCVPQCTGVGLPEQGITVFGSQLHTHLTGAAVWTRHARRGTELPPLNKDLHYSTHFQEIRILHRPVTVLPGDYLETTCVYNTLDKARATVGGHAITDEMCVNYLHYYPATELEVCKSAVSNLALENYFKFEREWDNMSISYASPPRGNYLAIHPWSPLRAAALHTLYTESPISMQCNKSDGNRFQGDWEGLQIPKVEIPLQEERRNCPRDFSELLNK